MRQLQAVMVIEHVAVLAAEYFVLEVLATALSR